MGRRRRRLNGERGETLIEFAIAGLVFFALVFAILQLGMVVWRYDVVSSLAQDGARWASVRGSTSREPATAAAVQDYVRGRALGRAVGVSTTPSPAGAAPGDVIRVVVEDSVAPLAALLPRVTIRLEGTAQMVVAR